MSIFTLNGKVITAGNGFCDADGTWYPAGWLQTASVQEKADLGIMEIPASVRPPVDDRYYWITQNEDLTWNVQEKPVDMFAPQFEDELDTAVRAVQRKFEELRSEYEERFIAALAYKDADYSGDEDESIAEWATNNGKTYREAVDIIIDQNNKARQAVKPLGLLRMKKGRFKNCASIADLLTTRQALLSELAAEVAKL